MCNVSQSRSVASGQGDFVFTSYNGSAYGERMRIDSDGNVGIGTDNPQETLHIYNADAKIRLENSGSTGIAEIYTSNQAGLCLDADPNNTDSGTPILFKTDGSERMRVDSSGGINLSSNSLGISFNGDTTSGTSRYLDDYEEGTYTVALTCGTSGTITLLGSKD